MLPKKSPYHAASRRRRMRRLGPALLVTLSAGLLGMLAVDHMQERGERARGAAFLARLDEQLATVDGLARRPLHDVREARASVAAQLAGMARELGLDRNAAGRRQEATAMGRLYLALGDADTASRFLDRAWADGERGPALRTARAEAHLRRLLDVLARPRGFESGAKSVHRKALRPSAEALKQSLSGIGADEPLIEGVELWLAGGAGQPLARRLAAAAVHREGASVQAESVQAELLLWADGELGEERLRAVGPGIPSWSEVASRLQEALRRRPSDPRLHRALCGTWIRRLQDTELEAAPEAPSPSFSQAQAACQDGLRVDPEDSALLAGNSWLDLAQARHRLGQGADPRSFLDDLRRTIAQARRRTVDSDEPAWLVADEAAASQLAAAWAASDGAGAAPR